MTIEAELSQLIVLEAARAERRKAYRAALRHVRAMRKAGAGAAELLAWARAQ